MPMMMPPLIWLSAVSLLTNNPASCTQTIFLTLTNPVSVSTSTSANCTPAAPWEESPCCHSPRTTRGFMPSFLHASGQLAPLASATPACCCNCSSALAQASKIAGATDAQVVLPPLPPEDG